MGVGLGVRDRATQGLLAPPIPPVPSATFTLTDDEEARAMAIPRLAEPIRHAIRDAQKTGPLKWCWISLADRRQVDAFLGLARRKAEWVRSRGGVRRSAAS